MSLYLALEIKDPELSLLLTDNPNIQKLNAEWRGEDKATDVLSFPLYEAFQVPSDAMLLGDIVISLDYAENTCKSQTHKARMEKTLGQDIENWEIEEEVFFLFIHGLLHLFGHDHLEEDEEIRMKAMEKTLWLSANSI